MISNFLLGLESIFTHACNTHLNSLWVNHKLFKVHAQKEFCFDFGSDAGIAWESGVSICIILIVYSGRFFRKNGCYLYLSWIDLNFGWRHWADSVYSIPITFHHHSACQRGTKFLDWFCKRAILSGMLLFCHRKFNSLYRAWSSFRGFPLCSPKSVSPNSST